VSGFGLREGLILRRVYRAAKIEKCPKEEEKEEVEVELFCWWFIVIRDAPVTSTEQTSRQTRPQEECFYIGSYRSQCIDAFLLLLQKTGSNFSSYPLIRVIYSRRSVMLPIDRYSFPFICSYLNYFIIDAVKIRPNCKQHLVLVVVVVRRDRRCVPLVRHKLLYRR